MWVDIPCPSTSTRFALVSSSCIQLSHCFSRRFDFSLRESTLFLLLTLIVALVSEEALWSGVILSRAFDNTLSSCPSIATVIRTESSNDNENVWLGE